MTKMRIFKDSSQNDSCFRHFQFQNNFDDIITKSGQTRNSKETVESTLKFIRHLRMILYDQSAYQNAQPDFRKLTARSAHRFLCDGVRHNCLRFAATSCCIICSLFYCRKKAFLRPCTSQAPGHLPSTTTSPPTIQLICTRGIHKIFHPAIDRITFGR